MSNAYLNFFFFFLLLVFNKIFVSSNKIYTFIFSFVRTTIVVYRVSYFSLFYFLFRYFQFCWIVLKILKLILSLIVMLNHLSDFNHCKKKKKNGEMMCNVFVNCCSFNHGCFGLNLKISLLISNLITCCSLIGKIT